MQDKRHGLAVTVILSSLLAPALHVAGCRSSAGDSPKQASKTPATTRPSKHPQMTREVVSRQTLSVPPEMAEVPPVASLAAGEQTMVYNSMGPLRLRVARADGSTLAEVEVRSGDVLVVDRRSGVRLSRPGGSQTMLQGPLDERTDYALYALPAGGVRQEAQQLLIRPETAQEREAREETATRPATTKPGGGP